MDPVGLRRAPANEAKVKWAGFSQATCWSVATSLTLHSHGRTCLLLIIRPELWQGGGIINFVTFFGQTNHRLNRQPRVPELLQKGISLSKVCFSFTRVKLIETVRQYTVGIRGAWEGGAQFECSYSIKMISEHRRFGSTYSSFWDKWVFTQ